MGTNENVIKMNCEYVIPSKDIKGNWIFVQLVVLKENIKVYAEQANMTTSLLPLTVLESHTYKKLKPARSKLIKLVNKYARISGYRTKSKGTN